MIDIFKVHIMLHISSVAGKSFFFGEGQVPIEILISPMHHSSIKARNEIFFGEGLLAIQFFLNPMRHGTTVAKNIFFLLKVWFRFSDSVFF